VHVIVHAENHNIVFGQEVELRLVKRIGVHDRYVVPVIPESIFVRNDHVKAGIGGTLHHVETAEHRRRNAFNLRGPSGLKVSRVVSRHGMPRLALMRATTSPAVSGHQDGLRDHQPHRGCGSSGTPSSSTARTLSCPILETPAEENQTFLSPALILSRVLTDSHRNFSGMTASTSGNI
jgi:hypothetical protein